jgi:hypothetical protein
VGDAVREEVAGTRRVDRDGIFGQAPMLPEERRVLLRNRLSRCHHAGWHRCAHAARANMGQEFVQRRLLFRVHRSWSAFQKRKEIGLVERLDAPALAVDPSKKRGEDPAPPGDSRRCIAGRS